MIYRLTVKIKNKIHTLRIDNDLANELMQNTNKYIFVTLAGKAHKVEVIECVPESSK